MFRDARKCIREAGDKPFLLMMWNYDMHWPYTPGPCRQAFDPRHFPPLLFADAAPPPAIRRVFWLSPAAPSC